MVINIMNSAKNHIKIYFHLFLFKEMQQTSGMSFSKAILAKPNDIGKM